jgi:hypothetical protein
LNIIITSHSAKIIGSFSDDSLVFLFRDRGAVKAASGAASPILRENMGFATHIDIVVLVEDNLAKELLRRILEIHNPSLSRRVEISVRNGDGNIVNSLRAIGTLKAIKIVGMFDGDMAGKIPPDLSAISGLLPGGHAIERLLRDIVSADPDGFSKAMGSGDIPAILSTLQGADHHDWYAILCAQVGLSREQLFPILFRLWHDKPANSVLAEQSVSALAALLEKVGN